MALICDTGPLYAAMDESDQDHTVCAELISRRTERLVVPAPVLVELDWLASRRLGPQPFESFLADVEDGIVRVVDLTPADYRRVRELCSRYRDLPLGFVDAAVLAMTERMQEPKLVTLDQQHFRVVRPRHVASLLLLPEEMQR